MARVDGALGNVRNSNHVLTASHVQTMPMYRLTLFILHSVMYMNLYDVIFAHLQRKTNQILSAAV